MHSGQEINMVLPYYSVQTNMSCTNLFVFRYMLNNRNTIIIVCIPFQDSGTLLSCPWPHSSDTKGKAVSFLRISMFIAQLFLAMSMGSLIDVWGGPSIIMFISLLAALLGGCTAYNLTIQSDLRKILSK